MLASRPNFSCLYFPLLYMTFLVTCNMVFADRALYIHYQKSGRQASSIWLPSLVHARCSRLCGSILALVSDKGWLTLPVLLSFLLYNPFSLGAHSDFSLAGEKRPKLLFCWMMLFMLVHLPVLAGYHSVLIRRIDSLVFSKKRGSKDFSSQENLCQSYIAEQQTIPMKSDLKCQLFMVSHNLVGELDTHWPPMGLSCTASAYKSLEKGTGQASSTRYFFIFRIQCSFSSSNGRREVSEDVL